jgi:transcriptional regulator with XRE-family HTH domain
MSADIAIIIDRLRRKRVYQSIASHEFSVQLGLDPTAWSRVETGKRALKASELITAAEVLGMSLDELVRE